MHPNTTPTPTPPSCATAPDLRWLHAIARSCIPQVQALGAGKRDVLAVLLGCMPSAAPHQLDDFLLPSLEREFLRRDFSALKNFDRACERILSAMARGRTIAICCDYDVDGTTAAAQFAHHFEVAGVPHRCFVSDRLNKGYGLAVETVLAALAAGAGMLLVLDQGTNDRAAMQCAKAHGLETIVIDHHHVDTIDGNIDCLVNPAQDGCGFERGTLCTSGLTFCLIDAVARRVSAHSPELSRDCLALATLGTIADMMALTGLNRAIVKEGLRALSTSACPGLAALRLAARKTGILSERDVAFSLAPMLNAASRMAHGSLALDLLTATQDATARQRAQQLSELNGERKEISRALLARARPTSAVRGGIVRGDASFHPGVIGIVAQQLAEETDCPVAILGRGPDEHTLAVSIRGRAWFDATQAFTLIDRRLLRGGGHREAAGGTVPSNLVPEFTRAWEEECLRQRSLPHSSTRRETLLARPVLPLELSAIDFELMDILSLLGPFGQGFPEPCFNFGDLSVASTAVLRNSHLKVTLSNGEQLLPAFLWNTTSHPLLSTGARVSVAGTLELSEYEGLRSIAVRPTEVSRSPTEIAAGFQETSLQPRWQIEVVDSDERLAALCCELMTRTHLSIDTETVFRSEKDHTLCLVQVGDPLEEKSYVIKVRNISSRGPLQAILESPHIAKVEHFSEFETARFREAGIEQVNVIDTYMIAKELFPYFPDHRLKTLTRCLLHEHLSKEEQQSDFARDNLSSSQIRYAGLDPEVTWLVYEALCREINSIELGEGQDLPGLMEDLAKTEITIREQLSANTRLQELHERKRILQAEATRALERGELEYEGEHGHARRGYVKKDIDSKLFREKFPGLLKSLCPHEGLEHAFDSLLFVPVRHAEEVLANEQIVGSRYTRQEIKKLIDSSRLSVSPSTSPEVVPKLPKDAQGESSPEILDRRKIGEIMPDLAHTRAAISETMHSCDAIRTLHIRRYLLQHRIDTIVRGGASYQGAWGVARMPQAERRPSFILLLKAVDELAAMKGAEVNRAVLDEALLPYVDKRQVVRFLRNRGIDPETTPEVVRLWRDVYRPTGEVSKPSIR